MPNPSRKIKNHYRELCKRMEDNGPIVHPVRVLVNPSPPGSGRCNLNLYALGFTPANLDELAENCQLIKLQ